jgi:hypothetical protein
MRQSGSREEPSRERRIGEKKWRKRSVCIWAEAEDKEDRRIDGNMR